jgi:hypothetical protein
MLPTAFKTKLNETFVFVTFRWPQSGELEIIAVREATNLHRVELSESDRAQIFDKILDFISH